MFSTVPQGSSSHNLNQVKLGLQADRANHADNFFHHAGVFFHFIKDAGLHHEGSNRHRRQRTATYFTQKVPLDHAVMQHGASVFHIWSSRGLLPQPLDRNGGRAPEFLRVGTWNNSLFQSDNDVQKIGSDSPRSKATVHASQSPSNAEQDSF